MRRVYNIYIQEVSSFLAKADAYWAQGVRIVLRSRKVSVHKETATSKSTLYVSSDAVECVKESNMY
jgi:hypothetical protein